MLEDLKRELHESTLLAFYDSTLATIIYVDGHQKGLSDGHQKGLSGILCKTTRLEIKE